MIKLGIVIALFLVSSLMISYGYSTLGDLVVSARPAETPIAAGQVPVIVGNVKDQGGNPVPGAKVIVTFSKETVTTTTNNMGSYSAQPTTPAEPGHYSVNVIASKDGYGNKIANTAYFVNGKPQTQPKIPIIDDVGTLVNDGITKNPLSQIIVKHMEELKKQQAEKEKKQQEIESHQKFLEEQRQAARNSLDEDLKMFEKQRESNTPRDAFARFVAGVDTVVHDIFWAQFGFTEKKHQQGLEAKNAALEEGKTSVEAMKIFQRKAAVSKKEVTDLNTELNIKYGFANQQTQEKFDELGKLPRKDSVKDNNQK